MSIDMTSEDFLPHHQPADPAEVLAALADLGAVKGELGFRIKLPHTVRADGTFDAIAVMQRGGGTDYMIYFERVYHGQTGGSVTATVGQFPGWMVVLAARALYTHVSAVGSKDLPDTPEGHILYALGLGPRPNHTES